MKQYILILFFSIGSAFGAIENDLTTNAAIVNDIEEAQVDFEMPSEQNDNAKAENSNSKTKKKADIFQSRLWSISSFRYQNRGEGLLPTDTDDTVGTTDINLETLIKPQPTYSFKVDLQSQISTAYRNESPIFEKYSANWIRVNELFFELRPVTPVSFLVGKYRRVFGPGLFQNPMDRHNPATTMPGDPLERRGAWQLSLTFDQSLKTEVLDDIALSLHFLPGSFENKYGIPTVEKNLLSVKVTNNSPRIVSETVKWDSTDAGFMGRLYLNFFKGDFNLVYYFYENQNQVGLSYAKYITPWIELHSENLFYQAPHLYNAQASGSRHYDALAGLRLEPTTDTGLFVEYLHRGDHDETIPTTKPERMKWTIENMGRSDGTFYTTPLKNYLMSSLYIRNIRDILSFTFNNVIGLDQGDQLYSLRTEIFPGPRTTLSLVGSIFNSRQGSFYKEITPINFSLASDLKISFK